MNKPREWWIDPSGSSKRILSVAPDVVDVGIFTNPYIHVIEFSAYEEARSDRMEEHWREACIAGEELKDKLAIAVEALEFYAGFSDAHRIFDNVSLMAKDALEKLK